MGTDGVNRIWRRAKKQPAFYGLVILSLGLGIGATTTVFAVVDAELFRELPYANPSELVSLTAKFADADPSVRFLTSPLNAIATRDRTTTLARLEVLETANLDLVGKGDPVRLTGVRTTPSLFETLGTPVRLGRALAPDDVGSATAVISEGLWNLAFGRTPDIVGSIMDLDGVPTQVVGVVPGDQAFPPDTEVWLPWRPEDAPEDRMQSGSLQLIARLRPAVTVADAQAEMDRIARELEALYPDHNRGRDIRVDPLRGPFVERTEPLLLALLGSVFLFLALTCANVATLMMVRLRRRANDVALRHALGATRRRLLEDALAEGVALAAAGAILGMFLSVVATPLLFERLTSNLPGSDATWADMRVLAFTVIVAASTVLVFAVGPALLGTRAAAAGLGSGSRGGTASRADRRLQTGVVAAQAAIGVLLLMSAAGAIERFRELITVDPGYTIEQTLTVRIPLQPDRWASLEERSLFLNEIRDRLVSLPTVTAAGSSNTLPVGDPGGSWSFSIEDLPPADESAFEVARGRLVTPGYLPAIGIPLLSGRDFEDADRLSGLPVVVISRGLADRYWPGQDPIGKRIKRRTYNSPFPWMTVVGVTGDVRADGFAQGVGPTIYMPYAQHDNRLGFEMSFALSVTSVSDAAVADVRRTLRELDPRMPLVRVALLEDLLDDALASQRSSGRFLGGFAALGLGLLAVGVFGVTARTVQERTRELGVRVALGAAPSRVVASVLGGAMMPLAIGAAIGLALALTATGPIDAALGGALDSPPWATVAGPALPMLVGLLASLGPAARAARRSPVVALRDET